LPAIVRNDSTLPQAFIPKEQRATCYVPDQTALTDSDIFVFAIAVFLGGGRKDQGIVFGNNLALLERHYMKFV
jgi:hypothetical protein